MYGATKRAGELAVLAADPDAAIVRAAGVFSGGGRDFPSAMWRLAAGGAPIRVVDDQRVTPVFAGDLAVRLLRLAGARDAGGMFHCGGAPDATWFEVARAALALLAASGGPARTPEPVASADFPRPAARPSDSRLAGRRLQAVSGLEPPDWRVGLERALGRWRGDAA
jgi:dTDP-4-dehydrorhamnose reductase